MRFASAVLLAALLTCAPSQSAWVARGPGWYLHTGADAAFYAVGELTAAEVRSGKLAWEITESRARGALETAYKRFGRELMYAYYRAAGLGDFDQGAETIRFVGVGAGRHATVIERSRDPDGGYHVVVKLTRDAVIGEILAELNPEARAWVKEHGAYHFDRFAASASNSPPRVNGSL